MRTISLALVLLALALATPALATDGVLEINQTCAVETGCFPGDAPGFPVQITTPGSYRLTSNLTGIGANVDALFLETARVTIDLNGFSLTGPSIGSGTGNGIAGGGVDGSFAGFTTIENGVIRGFRGKGVALGGATGVRVENVGFDFNAGGGVDLGEEARVHGCRFSRNGTSTSTSHGVGVDVGASVQDNVIAESGGHGILAFGPANVSGNTVRANGESGIFVSAGNGAVVHRNAVEGNGDDGIYVGAGAPMISENSVTANGGNGILTDGVGGTITNNTALTNAEDGIDSAAASNVRGNTVVNNGTSGTGYGLDLGPILAGSAYGDNVINNTVTATRGTVTGFATNTGGNVCNSSSTCP